MKSLIQKTVSVKQLRVVKLNDFVAGDLNVKLFVLIVFYIQQKAKIGC